MNDADVDALRVEDGVGPVAVVTRMLGRTLARGRRGRLGEDGRLRLWDEGRLVFEADGGRVTEVRAPAGNVDHWTVVLADVPLDDPADR